MWKLEGATRVAIRLNYNMAWKGFMGTYDVNALAPGATENITLQSGSDYVPGEKVVLLKYKPSK